MRIIHIADAHIDGRNFDKCLKAFEEVSQHNADLIVFSGDVFSKHNIADKLKTTGEQQGLLQFLLFNFESKVFLVGNHDKRGQQKSALEFLKKEDKGGVIEAPSFANFDDCVIGYLPWIDKSVFYAKECIGLSKSEAEQKFTLEIEKTLGFFKAKFAEYNKPSILFFHAEIAGCKINEGYTLESGSFTFNENALRATGANFITGGHIHKRGGLYAGALYQQNFGEEGNPQGFEVIDIINGKITQTYVELDLPIYKTFDIHRSEDLEAFIFFYNQAPNNKYKLRIYCDSLFDDKVFPDGIIVEKLFGKSEQLQRIEGGKFDISEEQLIEEYINLNPLGDIKIEELMEAINDN